MKVQVYLWRSKEDMPDELPMLISTTSEELPKTIRLISIIGAHAVERFYEYTNLKHLDLPLYHQVFIPTVHPEGQP